MRWSQMHHCLINWILGVIWEDAGGQARHALFHLAIELHEWGDDRPLTKIIYLMLVARSKNIFINFIVRQKEIQVLVHISKKTTDHSR